MALSRAGATGIITTSATPFGGSSGATGGNTSTASPLSGRSDPPWNRDWSRIPFPVARPAFVRRQRLEQSEAHAHGEAALRQSDHNLRDQHLAALQHAVCFCDPQRAGCALDLDADYGAAQRRIGGSAAVKVGR